MNRMVLILIALIGAGPCVLGALLVEDFEGMTPGGLSGQNGWHAVSGVNVVEGGLNYHFGNIAISGGLYRAQSEGLLSVGVGAPLATKSFAVQAGDVWFSFTVRVEDTVDASRYWFWASDTTNINAGITGAIATSSTGNNQLFAEVRNNTSGSSESLGTLVDGTVYYLVGRLSKDGTATNTNA